MRRQKIKEAGLVMLGLGLIGLFVLVADSVAWRYNEYSDKIEEQQIKKLLRYRNLLNQRTLRHEFKDALDFRELPTGNTFTMDEEW